MVLYFRLINLMFFKTAVLITGNNVFSALIEKKSMNQTSTSLPGAITPSFSLKSEHNINFGSQDAGEFYHHKFLILRSS